MALAALGGTVDLVSSSTPPSAVLDDGAREMLAKAVHEAGHAVVGLLLGLELERIEFGDHQPACLFRPPQSARMGTPALREKAVMTLQAGSVAVRELLGSAYPTGDRKDAQHIEKQRLSSEHLHEMNARTRTLVRTQGGRITRLGAELLSIRDPADCVPMLSGAEVRLITGL